MTSKEIKVIKETIETIESLVDQIYPEGSEVLKTALTRDLKGLLKGG